jgi:hypothetical protein
MHSACSGAAAPGENPPKARRYSTIADDPAIFANAQLTQ